MLALGAKEEKGGREGWLKNSIVGEARRMEIIREYLEAIEYAKRK